MTNLNQEICRLCLNNLENLQLISDFEKDCIYIVFPNMDLQISNDPMMCTDCSKLLTRSFNFKSQCLDIEDSIVEFKHNDNDPVDLELIVGISKDETKVRICRTCLGSIERLDYLPLEQGNDIMKFFERFIPEMKTEQTLQPVICRECEKTVKDLYEFVMLCINNEEKTKSSRKSLVNSEVIIISDDEDYKNDPTYTPVNENESAPPRKKRNAGDGEATNAARNSFSATIKDVYCKYCFFVTQNVSEAQRHIHSCPRNPNKTTTVQTTKSTRNYANNNKGKVVVKKIPNGNITNKNKIKIIENRVFITSTNVPIHATTVNNVKWSNGTNRDEEKEKEIVQAVKNNTNPQFLYLTVVVCNSCGFNSRSISEMPRHCNTNPTVNAGFSSYTAIFLCSYCAKIYKTMGAVNEHLESCDCKTNKPLLLLKVGIMYHCPRCTFCSHDNKLALEHLLHCGKTATDVISV